MATKSPYHLIFRIGGINGFGASIGKLALYLNDSVIVVSDVFSGGLRSPAQSRPIPPQTYQIKAGIKGTANSDRALVPLPGTNSFVLHHWYGIEKIDIPEAQVEWGHYRAALNEPRKDMAPQYRGNFLHGKLRPDDYTHGCICERSEQILQRLWALSTQTISLEVRA